MSSKVDDLCEPLVGTSHEQLVGTVRSNAANQLQSERQSQPSPVVGPVVTVPVSSPVLQQAEVA